MPVRAILFDLDGTLVDTRAASWDLFAETNLAFALGIDSREEFFRAFEGNFFESLARLVPDPARAAAAKAHFMELLRTRYHPALIPGMVDVVRALAPQCTLAVVSTNGVEAIRRILVGADIATCFSHVFSGDVEPRKSVSIQRFLADQRYAVHRMCSPEYDEHPPAAAPFDPHDVVLVTDTVGDIVETRATGIRAIGVSWGMHNQEQLLAAGAERVALWPQELIAWLRAPGGAEQTHACRCTADGAAACAAAPRIAAVCARGVAAPKAGEENRDAATLAAARLRRERQLRARQSRSVAAVAPAARAAAGGAERTSPDSVNSELLAAVRSIVAGGCR